MGSCSTGTIARAILDLPRDSVSEVDELQKFFSKVLEFRESIMKESRRLWENVAIFIRSLGRRVPADWVAKEVRLKAKLDYEPETFPIADDHIILCFKNVKDCSLVLKGDPWFVVGQLLAMESWEPNFIPSRRPIQKMVVWM